MVVFEERGKPEYPGEIHLSQDFKVSNGGPLNRKISVK